MNDQKPLESPNPMFQAALSRRRLLKASLAAGAATAAVPAFRLSGAAFADDSSPTPQTGGTATVIVAADPDSWDLTKSTWATWQAVCFLYDRLLVFDDKENLLPCLATDWSVSDDGLTYSLTLRDDVTFHDGTAFDGNSVKVNIQRHIDKTDSAFYTTYEPVDHVDVVDATHVNIVLKKVQPNFPWEGLAAWGALQLSPTSYQAQGGDNYGNPPVGTGPFKYVSYTAGSSIMFEKNDSYWGGAPYLDNVEVKIIPDTSVQLTELEAATSDVAEVGPKDVDTAKGDGLTVISKISPGVSMVSMNVSSGATADLAVRQAICQAIDRQSMLDALVYGYGELSWAGVTKDSPFYTESVPTWKFDTDAAGKTLDAAGWTMGSNGIRQKDGQNLSVNILSTDFTDWALYNQSFQEQLKAIGIDSTITSQEWNTFLDQWRTNQGGWNVTYMNQGSVFASDSPIQASWYPDSYWTITQIADATDPDLQKVSKQLQDLEDQFEVELDQKKRVEIGTQAQQLYYDNALSLFLWHAASLTAILPQLQGYDITHEGRIVELSKAWVQS